MMNNNNAHHQPHLGQAPVGIAMLGAVNQPQQQPIDRWAAGDPPLLPFIPIPALPPVPANPGHPANAPAAQPHPAAGAAASEGRHGPRCPICYIRRIIVNNGWNVAEFSCGLVAGLCLICITFFAAERAISACAKSAAEGRAPASVTSVLGDRSSSLASAVTFRLPCGVGAASPLTVGRR